MVDKAKIKLRKSKNLIVYAFRYILYLFRLLFWKLSNNKRFKKLNKHTHKLLKPVGTYIFHPVKSYSSRLFILVKRQFKKNPKIAWTVTATLALFIVSVPLYIWWSSIPRAPRLKTVTGDYLYRADGKEFTAFLGSRKNNRPQVQFVVNDSRITFTPASGADEMAEPTKEGKSLTFRNVYQNIDYQYQTTKNGIKEDIIIREPTIIRQFPFFVDFKGAHPKYFSENLAGGVFYDENGKYIFHFDEPYAIDANGERTDNVQLLLKREKNSGRYLAIVGVDPKWAHAKERVYPIRIDPTVVHDTSSEFAAGQLNRVKDTGSGSSPNLETYYQELPADEHTAALWHLNDNVSGNGQTISDSSGNGKNGTTNDGANDTGMDCTVSGQLDLGCQFDGTDDLITIPEDFGIFDGSQNFTLEAWINPDTTHNGRFVVSLQGERDWKFGVTSSGTFIFESYDGAVHTVSADYETGKWQHFVGVYSATGGLSLYKNGELADTDSWTGTPASQARQSGIGGETDLFAEYFDGTIDEVRISGVARTPEEIKLAAQRRPYSVFTSDSIDLGTSVNSLDSLSWTELGVTTGDGETVADSSNLVAQWNFNETSGTTANNDAEGSSCGGTPANCDGTLSGFSDTTGQDVAVGSGWTSDNRRWGAGSIMFDGGDDIVSVTDDASQTGMSALTLSAWVKADQVDDAFIHFLNKDGTGDRAYHLRYNPVANGSTFTFLISRDGTNNNQVASESPIETAKWFYVVGVWDGDSVAIYINGVKENESGSGLSGSIFDSSDALTIGASAASTNAFDGVIDNVQIYSRALSDSEILANYNSGQLEFQTRTSADNSSWEAWRPTTNEAQITSLDDSTNTNWDRDPNSNPSGDVIYFTSTNVAATNAYSYQQTLDGSATVATGDTVEYDVFAKNNIAEVGGIDIKYTDASYARQSGWTDQNAKNCHPGTDIKTFVFNRWYHRVCTIDSSDNGKTIDYVDMVNEDDTGASVETFYDNVVLKDSSGNIKEVLYTTGATDFNTTDIESDTSNTADSSVVKTHQPNPFDTSSDSNIKIEGSASYKSKIGIPKVTPDTGALWHFEETSGSGAFIKDSSSNSNHGTPTGTTLTESVVGKARDFNGTTDVINAGSTTNLDSISPLSTCSWIKPDGWGENNFGRIYQKGSDIIFLDNDGTAPSQTIRVTIGLSSGNIFRSGAANAITLNHWNHVCVTWSGGTAASSISIYINGAEVSSYGQATDGSGSRSNTGDLFIGNNSGGTRAFDGTIDELGIYDEQLSAEEIFELYRMGANHRITRTISSTDLSSKGKLPFYIAADRPGTYLEASIGESAFANYEPDANTLALYHLEEKNGSGSYIKDSSGNNYHATPQASPDFTQGKYGKGREMSDNSDDRLDPSSDIDIGTNWTVDTWFLSPINDTSSWRTLTRGEGGDHQIIVETGAWRLGTYDNTGSTGFNACSPQFDMNTLSDGWHHLAVVQDGTNINFYIDGQYTCQIASYTSTTDIGVFGNHLTGAQPWGTIDEFRVSDVARSEEEIRKAYEFGARRHEITIDFAASLDSGNLITGSGDTSFTVDATTHGLSEKGSKLFEEDKIVVKENVSGTEYIAQGDVTSVNESTGAVTVDAWDSGSTFPGSGFTANATVFKWQREYFDITEPLDSQIDAITNLTLRVTDGSEGRTIWLDDIKSSGDYMTNDGGSTISSSVQRYFQYRAIFSSTDTVVSPSLTSVTLTYTDNVKPNVPSLDSPADTATGISLTPDLKTTATDDDGDNIQYKIELCTDEAMTTNCQTFDQTQSQTGWSGQNADSGTTYTSGAQGTYTVQSALDAGTTYYWRSSAIDPAGTNTFSDTQGTPFSFTTNQVPNTPTLDSPADTATNQSLTPDLKTTATDNDSDNLQYRIELDTVNTFDSGDLQTFDQTSTQTGWSGQNADGGTTYTSGTQATYTIQSALDPGTTYYWRSSAIDPNGTNTFGSTQGTPFSFTTSQAPTQPTSLQAEGSTNPVGVTDSLPEFSAICNDPDSGDTLDMYQIQVDDNSDFSSTVWDSGASGASMTSCTEGTRSSEIEFGGSELALDGTTYYWRIKFWDAAGNEGVFSTENALFTMATATDDGPTNCRIQESTDDSALTLLWDDNSSSETQFRIEKNVNSAGFSFLVNAAANSTSHEDTDVSQGNTYQYRIRAENGGTSNWCTTDTVSLQEGTVEFQGINIQGVTIE